MNTPTDALLRLVNRLVRIVVGLFVLVAVLVLAVGWLLNSRFDSSDLVDEREACILDFETQFLAEIGTMIGADDPTRTEALDRLRRVAVHLRELGGEDDPCPGVP